MLQILKITLQDFKKHFENTFQEVFRNRTAAILQDSPGSVSFLQQQAHFQPDSEV